MNVKHILCAVALTLVLFCQGGQSSSHFSSHNTTGPHPTTDYDYYGGGHSGGYYDGSVFSAASGLHVSHVSAVGVLLLSLYALIHA
ncbi:hypothetical protein JOB18_035505 [Solea senegalensis]|uniref:Uncharacterized protein n=1 Tax=Solea senegalensis TaxID=28829 RepID=A0AAV6QW34_SOLSE|nr:hypothetical protein JOB18_035505 [Solea senegalensis]